MFNKQKEKSHPEMERPNRQFKSSSVPSLIGSDIRMIGNVTTPGEVQLDGIIEGDIVCGTLTIGEHGLVTGLVKADNLVLRGQVEGKIRAKTIHFERSARINGDVSYETITMEAGVQIDGKLIPMNKDKAKIEKPEKAPLASDTLKKENGKVSQKNGSEKVSPI